MGTETQYFRQTPCEGDTPSNNIDAENNMVGVRNRIRIKRPGDTATRWRVSCPPRWGLLPNESAAATMKSKKSGYPK